MKYTPAGKQQRKLVYTHRGHACTVRRIHRHGGTHHASEIISAKPGLNLWQRLILSLLPHVALGEIV